MGVPKDPEKLEAYRDKMRRIALERGYGKWMSGKRRSPESVQKTRRANLGKTISEEHRQALSEARRRELVEGKDLFGGEAGTAKARETVSRQRKGKTLEEVYGPQKAAEVRRKASESNIGAHENRRPHPNRGAGSRARTGKTYEEIYGPDRAAAEAKKRSDTQRAKHADEKPDPSRRAKHNGDWRYVEWRKAVFARDDYVCQDCGQRGGRLHAHHVESWSGYPELRYEVSNGLTMCVPCHTAVHFPRS